jgi:aldose 1-epimerase
MKTTGSRQKMTSRVRTARLSNHTGAEVLLLDHGASIQSFHVPAGGESANVVLGYTDPVDHLRDTYYIGSVVGRYTGRIRHGVFYLGGHRVEVETQQAAGGHSLHGGPGGFHSRTWSLGAESGGDTAVFSYRSPDGEQGFPGALDASIRYRLEGTALIVELTAISHADTVVNLANHAYFNLGRSRSIDGHEITINADAYTPIDSQGIPNGDIVPVTNTDFDFRQGATLRRRLAGRSEGFDHNFVLNKNGVRAFSVGDRDAPIAASAFSADTGLRLNVYTTQPGLQFYTGQFLGKPFKPFEGFCFEAQAFPDSPNHPQFPSTVLRAGERYNEIVVYEVERASACPQEPGA